MRCARPSTIAVLPTPGSPISTGLFLVRRCSTWIARRISSSRPITGSSLPWRARSVRSSVYFFSASRWPSASAESTFSPPRTASIAASSALRVRPWPRTMPPRSVLASASASRNISLAMNWSPRLVASFSAACSSATRSRPGCTGWPPPCTCGSAVDRGVHRRLQRARCWRRRGRAAPSGRRAAPASRPAGGPARCTGCRAPRPGSGPRPGLAGTRW